jgi:maltose alpha-D-glucosyltransferase/alpha-amylase
MLQMGRRIGELHAALASRADIDGFRPEPITAEDLRTWSAALVSRTVQVFDQLDRDRRQFSDEALTGLEELLSQRQAVLDHIGHLLPAEVDADKIRHHGDLHLGQVLIVKDDAFIIDFEGEPNRSGEDRRSKAPSARDVAGMIRSLDYAAKAALQRIVKATPEECTRLAAFLDHWRRRATVALLAGVRETAGQYDRLWPKDVATADKLLRFFVAEKAIYEIGYELANRPDWLAVPVAGALRAIFGETGERR